MEITILTVLFGVVMMVFSTLFCVLIYYTAVIAYLHIKYDHLPGPKRTNFFTGNLTELRSGTRPVDHVLKLEKYKTKTNGELTEESKPKPLMHIKLKEWFEIYGDTFVLFILSRVFIVTRSPNLIKTVLVNSDQRDFPKTSSIKVRYMYGERYMGDGLATAVDHDSWYLRRKVLDPIFRRNQLRSMIDVFNTTGDCLIAELQQYADSGDSVILSPLLHRTTIDVIMKAMFSMDSHNLSSDFHKLAMDFVIDTFNAVQIAGIPLVDYNPLFYFHRKYTRKQLTTFRALGHKMILDRKDAICRGEDVPEDLLTTMILAHMDSNTGYSFDIMVDEFITFVVAGMETSANTLCFVFMELGRRPELVEKLLKEVDDAVGKKSFISNEDITKLPFTSTLIKESLRLYPPATGILRNVKKEVVIDGLRLPANSELMISFTSANTNEKYVESANEFRPERFNAAEENRVPVYSFLSFSLGSRNCIGQIFAQMEMKVMLAKFFQHFTLNLDKAETFELGQRATIFPLSGIKCTLNMRH